MSIVNCVRGPVDNVSVVRIALREAARLMRRAITTLLVASLVACNASDTLGGVPANANRLVTSAGRDPTLMIVDVFETGGRAAGAIPLPLALINAVLSPHGHRVAIGMVEGNGPCAGVRALYSLDLSHPQDGAVFSFGASCAGTTLREADIRNVETMAMADDGRTVFLWGLWVDQRPALAALSYPALIQVAVDTGWLEIAPMAGVTAIPSGEHANATELVVIGRRASDVGSMLDVPIRVADAATLQLIDSIPRSVLPSQQQIQLVVPCAGSDELLIVGRRDLVLVDRSAKSVVATTRRRGFGLVVATPRCERVLEVDGGGESIFALTGAGVVWIHDGKLARTDSIDISTPLGGAPFSGAAIRTGGVVISEDGSRAWVRSGFDGDRASALRQPARILTLDLHRGALVGVTELGGDSSGWLWQVRQ